MDLCFICLLACSICWTISPIFNSRAGKYYEEKDYTNMLEAGITGFSVGILGTILFIIATSLCDSLSTSVVYTYALPIVFTTIASIFLYGEVIDIKTWFGIFLILCGLYLV